MNKIKRKIKTNIESIGKIKEKLPFFKSKKEWKENKKIKIWKKRKWKRIKRIRKIIKNEYQTYSNKKILKKHKDDLKYCITI